MGIFLGSDKNKDLIKACKKGDLESVRKLLSEGVDPNGKKDVPLCVASVHGHVEIVELLLEKGADINLKDRKGYNALMYASYKEYTDHTSYKECVKLVTLLLDRGADINSKSAANKLLRSSMMIALERENPCIAKLLLDRGCNVNDKDVNGWTPLIIASFHGYPGMVELLLKCGADVCAKNNSGVDAFLAANFKLLREGTQFAPSDTHLVVLKLIIDHLPPSQNKPNMMKSLTNLDKKDFAKKGYYGGSERINQIV